MKLNLFDFLCFVLQVHLSDREGMSRLSGVIRLALQSVSHSCCYLCNPNLLTVTRNPFIGQISFIPNLKKSLNKYFCVNFFSAAGTTGPSPGDPSHLTTNPTQASAPAAGGGEGEGDAATFTSGTNWLGPCGPWHQGKLYLHV